MRMPFEKLMELVAAIPQEEAKLPIGEFAKRWGEDSWRIADAIDAVRVTRGERTYISASPEETAAADELAALTEELGLHDSP